MRVPPGGALAAAAEFCEKRHMTETSQLLQLNALEVRVLGCLMEKQLLNY